jgi:hypothetical protein
MRSRSLSLHARVLRAAAIAVPLALTLGPVAFAIASCNASTNLVNKGGECFLASDCAPGLVCVEINKQRVCSDDLTGVAGRPPPEGGAPREAGEGGDADPDAPQPVEDSGTDTNKPDNFIPDTSVVDTGNG